MLTLKPQSNEPLYSNTTIGTLAVDGWAVTFGIARRACAGCGPAQSPPRCTKCKPTHQQPVYQLRIIECGAIVTFARLKQRLTRRWHVTISCQPDGRPPQQVRPWKSGRVHLADGSKVVVLELPYSTEFGRESRKLASEVRKYGKFDDGR